MAVFLYQAENRPCEAMASLPFFATAAGGKQSSQPLTQAISYLFHLAAVVAGSPHPYGIRDDGVKIPSLRVFARRRSRRSNPAQPLNEAIQFLHYHRCLSAATMLIKNPPTPHPQPYSQTEGVFWLCSFRCG